MGKLGYSLRALYRTLEEPGANRLRAAYGMPLEKSGAATDPLAFLLALNLNLAAKEKAGETMTSPGLPLPEAERISFVTDDCVRTAAP